MKTVIDSEMLEIIVCKTCNSMEYYGAMYWDNGKQVCRKCIFRSWQIRDPKWSPGAQDYIYPKYLDGRIYRPSGED